MTKKIIYNIKLISMKKVDKKIVINLMQRTCKNKNLKNT